MDFLAPGHDNAAVASAESDRRRTGRTACEPIRVRVNVYRHGTLVDLSQGGALVHLQSEPPPVAAQVTLAIEWTQRTLYLPARVVRSIPRGAESGSAPGHTEYEVALEFLTLGANDATSLEGLIKSQVDTTRMKRPT